MRPWTEEAKLRTITMIAAIVAALVYSLIMAPFIIWLLVVFNVLKTN